ncbi:MAG: hypothetical protein K2Q06_03800, partial [Parvularculaceae bacterium]|nr:hypothetical protein [Parvularculaceae bacterium]
MDLYRDDEPPIRQATVRRRPPISDASALLVVMAAIAVMGAGAAWIGFHLGESSIPAERREAAAPQPAPKLPALREEPAAPAAPATNVAPVPPSALAAPEQQGDQGLLPRLKPQRIAEAAIEPEVAPSDGMALVL